LPQSVRQVQPALGFLPQSFNPLALGTMQALLPAWLQLKISISEIRGENLEQLVELYRQFDAGKVRFFLAFRHPSIDDPFCMAYLLGHLVPAAARRQKAKLRSPVHSYFLYDRGIPLWAGSFAGWLFPRIGGSSIVRGKVDMLGLRAARDLFVNGAFPLAAAPEGATNNHSELVSPLEPGVAQLGFWCVEDLIKANRQEQVLIVPVGIQYHYPQASGQRLRAILNQLEADVGLPPLETPTAAAADVEIADLEAALYPQLLRLSDTLLGVMEKFYADFYGQTLPDLSLDSTLKHSNAERVARLQRLIAIALQVAESYFGVHPKGSFVDRCRRLEQAGWDRIYREDVTQLSTFERGLADWLAEEASLRMWHMRLTEAFVAVTGNYVLEKPTADRFAEMTLILWKIVTWIKGGNPNRPPNLGKRWVQMTIGQPLSVRERWPEYAANRRSAKQAVTDLTQDLQVALQSLIK
jgi:hypothetical protein